MECNRVSGRQWERGAGCEGEFSDLTPCGVSLDDNRKGSFRDSGYGGHGGGRCVAEEEEEIEKKEVKNIRAVKRGENYHDPNRNKGATNPMKTTDTTKVHSRTQSIPAMMLMTQGNDKHHIRTPSNNT